MKKIKELESDCRFYPYLWESTKSFGLNKDVTAETYTGKYKGNNYMKDQYTYPMMNLEIMDRIEQGWYGGSSSISEPRYQLVLWWLGDEDRVYLSNNKSVIKSMFYSGVKFLHKRLEKDNLTSEDIEKAYDDCADMLEKRYIIEDKRAKLINAHRFFSRGLRNWGVKKDLRKYRTWTDEEVLEEIEKDKVRADKKNRVKMTEIKLTRKEFLAMEVVGGDWDGIKSLRESFRGKGYSLFVKNKTKCIKTIKNAINRREEWQADSIEGWESVINKIKES
jgi:hypothetical protein